MGEEINKLDVGETLTPDDFISIPLFAGIPKSQLEKNKGAYVLRKFKKGEVICREGEQGSTAFYIKKGSVKAFIKASLSTVKTKSSGKKSFFGNLGKMTSFLSKAKVNPEEHSQSYIPIDASVDLSMSNPVAILNEGDIFGEMTCLSLYPRSATIVANEDCELVEMLRNVFKACLRDKEFKKIVDDKYRARTLVTHLKSIPLFWDVSSDIIDHLKNSVELISLDEDQVICNEGDAADSLYLVRMGFVKVSKKMPGGELVLSYLSRGMYFGEMGLMDPQARRTATCRTIDPVELVKISAADFNMLVNRFPGFKAEIQKTVTSRQKTNQQLTSVPQNISIGDYLDQGLFQAQNLLVLDLTKCTRCDACTQACASTHNGVTRLLREGLRFQDHLIATSCRQCNDPLCMVGCPVGSIRRKDSSSEIIIEDWCIGCGMCAKSCPYGNITLHPFTSEELDPENPGKTKPVVENKATTCDHCTDLAEPSCVYACPHDAAHRVDPREYFKYEVSEDVGLTQSLADLKKAKEETKTDVTPA